MKKYILCLLMSLLLLVCAIVGSLLSDPVWAETSRFHHPPAQKVKNPAPPDLRNLQMLGLQPFVSNLPVVMIHTGSQQIVKESMKSVRVAIFDDSSGKNDILGMADTILYAGLKLRGASSYHFDKNQYRLKFYREESMKKALDFGFLGLPPDSDWILHGPFLDQSLLRNYLMYTLSGEVMDWAPHCRFLELFVDGRYEGVYLAVESISEDPERLNLTPFGLLSGRTAYLVVRDRPGTEPNGIETYGSQRGLTANQLSIRFPSRNSLTSARQRWIETDLSQFEQALYSDGFGDPQMGYNRYIDVHSFADYLILEELSMTHDAGNLSAYIYKNLGGRLRMAVWDFNDSFDNYQWFHREVTGFETTESAWFDRLLQDRHFVDLVVSRYRQLRKSSLSDDHMQQVLMDGRRQLGDAVGRNFHRWGYTFTTPLMTLEPGLPDRNPESYPEAFNRLLQVMHRRTAFLDAHIEDLYRNCIN